MKNDDATRNKGVYAVRQPCWVCWVSCLARALARLQAASEDSLANCLSRRELVVQGDHELIRERVGDAPERRDEQSRASPHQLRCPTRCSEHRPVLLPDLTGVEDE